MKLFVRCCTGRLVIKEPLAWTPNWDGGGEFNDLGVGYSIRECGQRPLGQIVTAPEPLPTSAGRLKPAERAAAMVFQACAVRLRQLGLDLLEEARAVGLHDAEVFVVVKPTLILGGVGGHDGAHDVGSASSVVRDAESREANARAAGADGGARGSAPPYCTTREVFDL